jgi:hypothetical protein
MRVRIGGALGLAAAVILAVATLAACSNRDEPSTLPDTTPTGAVVSPSESGSPTPSADPTAQLEAEITEFYELYVQTINESFSSGAALQLRRSLFAETCLDCQRGYELAKRAHAESLTLGGGTISIVEISVDDLKADQAVFTSTTNSTAGTLTDEAGNVVQTLVESRNLQIVYQVARIDTKEWIITSSEVS